MPSRPDLREIATHLRDAFADADRDTLLEVLTFVLKEYVVEGPPPMLIHQAETLSDLRGATFAQLITALQTRFDHPELAMFVVDGEQVGVRVGGVVQPLLASRQPMAAAELPRPAAGVRVVETTLQQRPPQPAPSGFIDTRQGDTRQGDTRQGSPAAPAAQPASAPPPVRGVSLRGRPTGEGAEPAPSSAPPAGAAPAPPSAAPAAPQNDKPESSGDDASARFSLLELD